ncbi:GTP cyclohydrolase FolE2 [Desulfuromonas thiophila]|uniref:GTP cyclohydrolase FolE2 n=1 Tax=Desulfuromonas thiophila TaxID=57664 RepID=A0A1G7CLJ2_9BACT|nr:GTP cyclohydrolase FolE2 [Desulfuromonas thiophila]SDE40189.1 GTP cyclohydrolase I [Desulfuromonas thiophila]
MKTMPDLQQSRDTRQIAIDRVGIKDVRYPIVVLDKNRSRQHTIASVNMYVELPHQFKGTHMSRFVEILNQYRGEITFYNMDRILAAMKERLESDCAHMELSFPYFIEKTAPVSGARSLMSYDCRFIGTLATDKDFVLEVCVPLTSLCPCSREISRYGAHNQRSYVRVAIRAHDMVWIEDLVALVEECGSAPVYALLKREDEKAVTEQAYENPRFVEDIVREVTRRLKAVAAIDWFSVECENFESIHDHSAYATLEYRRG